MAKLKPLPRLICALLIAALLCAAAFASPASVDSNAEPFAGSGTADDPYCYLIDENCKATWKHFQEIKDAGVSEKYQKREGDVISGTLLYEWLYHPENITAPNGPYFLGISFYPGVQVPGQPDCDSAKFFSTVSKRDMPGVGIVTMRVSDMFADGTRLDLYYYGGYDATVYHLAAPEIDPNEIYTVGTTALIASDITVSGGYITFRLRYGGNFYLIEHSDAPAQDPTPSPSPAQTATPTPTPDSAPATPDPAVSPTPDTTPQTSQTPTPVVTQTPAEPNPTPVYTDPEAPLGTIEEVFTEPAIAKEIATQLGRSVTDTVSAADLSGILTLYLDNAGLTSLESLSGFTFAHLTSLSAANNALTVLCELDMPMLERLDLSGNAIVSMPGLKNTMPLKHLLLAGNAFTRLPPELARITTLQTLDLSDNELTDIDGLNMPKLTFLNLSGNRIEGTPDLSGCPRLIETDLSNQRLAAENVTEPAGDGETPNNYTAWIITGAVILAAGAVTAALLIRRKAR